MASDIFLAAAIGAFLGVLICGLAIATYVIHKIRRLFGGRDLGGGDLSSVKGITDLESAMDLKMPNAVRIHYHFDALRRSCACAICAGINRLSPQPTFLRPTDLELDSDPAEISDHGHRESHQFELIKRCACPYCSETVRSISLSIIRDPKNRLSDESFKHTIDLRRKCQCDHCRPLVELADVAFSDT